MGLSHFLPQGGAEYDASPTENIDFLLKGEVIVVTEKEKILLKKWDSIHSGANEGRSIINQSNQPASMLVILNYKNRCLPSDRVTRI